MKRNQDRARINLLREAWKSGPDGFFDALLESRETEEALRFAGQGKLSVKWQIRAAVLDMARVMKG